MAPSMTVSDRLPAHGWKCCEITDQATGPMVFYDILCAHLVVGFLTSTFVAQRSAHVAVLARQCHQPASA